MTGLEVGAISAAVTSLIGNAVTLWGTKKDRINGELTADKLSNEYASQVRKELEASLQGQTQSLRLEINEYRAENREMREKFSSERVQWENERRDLIQQIATLQGQINTLQAQHRAELAEMRLEQLQRQKPSGG